MWDVSAWDLLAWAVNTWVGIGLTDIDAIDLQDEAIASWSLQDDSVSAWLVTNETVVWSGP